MYSSKKHLGSISYKILLSEKQHFCEFLSQKVLFLCSLAGVRVYLPLLAPSTATPCPGTPLANSQRTKQFLSCLHGLLLFVSEGAELPTEA
jgi:hypothetical protein